MLDPAELTPPKGADGVLRRGDQIIQRFAGSGEPAVRIDVELGEGMSRRILGASRALLYAYHTSWLLCFRGCGSGAWRCCERLQAPTFLLQPGLPANSNRYET